MTPVERRVVRSGLRRVRDWMRRHYGIRELILPEKYSIEDRHDVVVTYSSSLALVYFASVPQRMMLSEIVAERRRAHLYAQLLTHPGVGLIGTLNGPAVHLESARGRAVLVEGTLEVLDGENPLEPYGVEPALLRAVEHLVRQPNAGDLMIFGAFDGYEIVCFDDQIGAHGAAGGNQTYPFILGPRALGLEEMILEDARDLHSELMVRYARVV